MTNPRLTEFARRYAGLIVIVVLVIVVVIVAPTSSPVAP
jgi:hypothetical protein